MLIFWAKIIIIVLNKIFINKIETFCHFLTRVMIQHIYDGGIMKIKNSYILLDNEHEVNDTAEHISFGDLEKSEFKDFFVNNIKCLLKDIEESENCDEGMTISKNYKGKYQSLESVEIMINLYNVGYDIFMEIELESDNDKTLIECLETLDDKLNDNALSSKYTLIMTYDSISEHYTNLSYVKLNKFERLFRQLFFNIYVVNFGKEYYNKTISKELSSDIKAIIGAKGSDDKKQKTRMKEFFYSMTYEHMIRILFEKSWSPIEQKYKEDALLKTDYQTIEEIKEQIKLIEPKNDFERLFKEKFTILDDFEKLLNELRILRNKVAHCKIYRKEDYTRCNEIIDEIENQIIEANKIVYVIDFSKRNKIYMEPLYNSMIQGLQEIGKILVETVSDVISSISKSYLEK